MFVNFCIFTDVEGQQVAVSPDFVCYIRPVSADATKIEFGGSHSVTVKASLIDVTRGLHAGRD